MGKNKELYIQEQERIANAAIPPMLIEDKTIYKNLHNIHTSWTSVDTDETMLVGTDEDGVEMSLTLSTMELIEWIDRDHLKECLIKYIQKL
jgi:hypothetical protein